MMDDSKLIEVKTQKSGCKITEINPRFHGYRIHTPFERTEYNLKYV